MKEARKSRGGARRKGRELTVQALYQYDKKATPLAILLSLDWVDEKVPQTAAVSYFRELLEGTMKNLEIIDQTIKDFAQKYEFNKVMPIDKAILRFAVYSLFFERELPAVIIIDEAVELTKLYGGRDAHKFVNGVLDGIRKKLVEQGQRKGNE